MGIGSSLLQFVESLRQDPQDAHGARPLPREVTPAPTPAAPRAPEVRAADPLAEVARALVGSRQRLEALADRLATLRTQAGGAARSPSSPPTPAK